MQKKVTLSKISATHYVKLVFRSTLLLIAAAMYVMHLLKDTSDPFGGFEYESVVLGCIWLVYFIEMILRFFPSSLESMGCQKQFAKNYKGDPNIKIQPRFTKDLVRVILAWTALNGLFGVLYFIGVIDAGILMLSVWPMGFVI